MPLREWKAVDAENALPAQFTPDSQAIVFHSPDLRVEKWSIAEERRIDLHEMTVGQDCISVKLSPDGKHLACLNLEFKLTMFNVADGLQVFQKKFKSAPIFLPAPVQPAQRPTWSIGIYAGWPLLRRKSTRGKRICRL